MIKILGRHNLWWIILVFVKRVGRKHSQIRDYLWLLDWTSSLLFTNMGKILFKLFNFKLVLHENKWVSGNSFYFPVQRVVKCIINVHIVSIWSLHIRGFFLILRWLHRNFWTFYTSVIVNMIRAWLLNSCWCNSIFSLITVRVFMWGGLNRTTEV